MVYEECAFDLVNVALLCCGCSRPGVGLPSLLDMKLCTCICNPYRFRGVDGGCKPGVQGGGRVAPAGLTAVQAAGDSEAAAAKNAGPHL